MPKAEGCSQPPPRPTYGGGLPFSQQPMVRWLAPQFLVHAGWEVRVSARFAAFADKRETEAGLPDEMPSYVDDSQWENGDLWIDFASDVGEGFDPTYTVAWLLAKPSLTFTHKGEDYDTKRGRILVLGGDEVYPSASWDRYRDRFVGPYTAALPWVEDSEAPHLFAIPGNHDWYDGLTSFVRVFCQGSWVGGWRTRQRRSYFALQLREDWWLWATDIQFDTYIDAPQLDYFRAAAGELKAGHRVILATAKPSWLGADERKTELMATGSWETLSFVEEELIANRGAEVAVTLTGDKHHYARYEAIRAKPLHRVTAGGGGAHTSATHGLPTDLSLPIHGSNERTRYHLECASPSADESKGMRNRIVGRVLRVFTMGLLIGVIYALVGWAMAAAVGDGDPLVESVEGHSPLELIPDAGSAASLFAIAILAALLFVFARMKQPAGPLRAVGFAVAHTAGHAVALVLLLVGGLVLLEALDAAEIGWIVALVAVLGYFAGLIVFGLYLQLANRISANQHATEIYGGLASTEYKNFLRLRLRKDGSLTIYPVGVRRSGKWFHREEGDPRDPWFVAASGQEPEAKLLEKPFEVPAPTNPRPSTPPSAF